MGKSIGLIMRFIYGYLVGYIYIAIIYIVVAITVILVHPKPFWVVVVEYIQTPTYNKLNITLWGHLIMVLFGMVEWQKCKIELRKRKKQRKNKRRKKVYEQR